MLNNMLMALTSIILLCACSKQEKLSDGYEVFRQYGNVHAISSPDGRVIVFGDVNQAREINNLIVGKRSRPEGNEADAVESDKQPYGYFIFDKSTKSLVLGLSKEAFDKQNQEQQIGNGF
ncbi:MAG: hypothetical protein U5M23_05395 [Marinagarivorans sp.]|nr:hypothetical protein [Marinagarivorans sp.]